MKGLTDRQRIFAEGIVKGMTKLEAYAHAGYSTKNRKAAENNALRLMGNEGVKAIVDKMREESTKSAIWDRNRMIQFLCTILEIPYTSLINPDTGSLNSFEDNPDLAKLVTGYKVQEKVNAETGDVWGLDKDVKFYSKEKAADQLVKLMGWNEPEKIEVTGSIVERIRERNKKRR